MILACAGEDPEGSSTARVQQILQHGVEWERLTQLAEQHGLVPVLYRRLSTAVDLSQPALLETLRQQDEVKARRTLWLTLELLNIHKHLAARGLQVLPYKGPVLAHRLYGNVALRQFSDLDLLVRAHDLFRIKAALAELGYALGLRLTPAAQRAYLRSGYEYTFDSPRGQNLVEIKWQILPQFYSINFDVNDFFERALVVTVEGQNMRTPCDLDLMLVLCVHAAKHVWMQLSWLCDIVQLARSQALDWDALSAEAARLGIKRIVTVSFLLAQKLLGVPLPALLASHEDPAAEVLAQKILQMIVADKQFDPESVSYFRLMMDLRERGRDRTSFLWRLCVTPSAGEWCAIQLPGPLFPLYRVVRMFRLARRMVFLILRS